MKQLDNTMLASLAQQAQHSPRKRANHNLHADLSDPIQRLAIAMEPDTCIRPHRHLQTWELLTPLRGRFVVLHFDDNGTVIARAVLGEETQVLEHGTGVWHGVLSLDAGGVIFEVKHGPYLPITENDYLPGIDLDDAQLNAWYAKAQVGDNLMRA